MRDLIFLYIGYGFIIYEHPKTLISTWIASVVIYVILTLNLVVSVDCNSFASIRLPLCLVQPYFGNTRLMKIENAMSVICVECYLQGAECNICCCFYIVCPWAVFSLLHILFSAEQVFVPLYLCLQGCYVFLHEFPFYQITFLSLSQKKKKKLCKYCQLQFVGIVWFCWTPYG